MPNIGGIGGWIERFQPCEGAVKSPWFLCAYSLPTSCWSSVALSWTDPFPQHYGWHFPYLWSASQGSWLLQQHLLNNNGQNIKSFYSCYVAATTEMKPFLLKGLNTVTGSRPVVKKSLKFLLVVEHNLRNVHLCLSPCALEEYSASTCLKHKVRKEKHTWYCEKGNMLQLLQCNLWLSDRVK